MGKKPVVMLFGLAWAGMALAGCQGNKNNSRDKFNAPPTFQTKNTGATPQGGPASGAPTETTVAGEKSAPVKPQDLPGTTGFGKAPAAPDAGQPTAMPAATPVSNPATRSSMRPGDDATPRLNEQPGLPGRGDNMGGLPEMPGSGVSKNNKMDFPATPVFQQVGAQRMMPPATPISPPPPAMMPPETKLPPGIRDLPPLGENNVPANPAAAPSSPPLPDPSSPEMPPLSPPPGVPPLLK